MSKELFEELDLTIAELRKENQELKETISSILNNNGFKFKNNNGEIVFELKYKEIIGDDKDIHSIICRKKERLKKLNDFDYITTMNDVKRNNEIYRLKGYIEALSDVKNKKVYTQERDILEKIYKNVDENTKKIIQECWR